MYEFLDRLVNIALPRVKDFRGLSSNGFDKFGNYTFGIKEHIIFPEVSFDRADKVRGLDIVIVISSKNKEQSLALLNNLSESFILLLFLFIELNFAILIFSFFYEWKIHFI